MFDNSCMLCVGQQLAYCLYLVALFHCLVYCRQCVCVLSWTNKWWWWWSRIIGLIVRHFQILKITWEILFLGWRPDYDGRGYCPLWLCPGWSGLCPGFGPAERSQARSFYFPVDGGHIEAVTITGAWRGLCSTNVHCLDKGCEDCQWPQWTGQPSAWRHRITPADCSVYKANSWQTGHTTRTCNKLRLHKTM